METSDKRANFNGSSGTFRLPAIDKVLQAVGDDTPGLMDHREIDAVSRKEGPRGLNIPQQSNLTLGQLHVWMGQGLVPDAPVYHLVVALNLSGEIEPAPFQAAFQALVDASDALRTVIETRQGVPYQVVRPTLPYAVEYLDLSLGEDPRGVAQTWMRQRSQIPFDPADRLFDSALLKTSAKEFVWYLNCHHLIADGWSFELIYRQMEKLYADALGGRLPAVTDLPPFREYVVKERQSRESARYCRAERYWQQWLSQKDPPLAFYGGPSNKRTTRVRRVSCQLGPDRSRKLKSVMSAGADAASGPSVVTIFCSILLAYLHRLHDHETYSIGLPFHNRRSPRFKETIGFFSEMLPIRVEIAPEDTLASLREKVRKATLETLRHSPYALPNPPHRPAYDVVVNYHVGSFARFNGATAVPEWIHTGHGGESLTLQIRDFTESGALTLDFDFHGDAFTVAEGDRAVGHFLSVLDAFLESPAQRLDQVALPCGEERRRLLIEWNATAAVFPRNRCIHHLIEEQAQRRPDATAVSCEGERLTYGELNDRADQLAAYLGELGVGPGTLVGVCLRRSPELVVSILATLKTGAAYVPLDPTYPPEWLAFVLDDTRAPVILTHTDVASNIPGEGRRVVCLDADWFRVARRSRRRGAPPFESRRLAYVIYTSGSTGKPKGVEVTHEALVNFATWAVGAYQLTGGDRVLQFAALSFDTSAEEIFPSLIAGAQLVLRTDAMLDSIRSFGQACEAEEITVLDLPTAYWHELVAAVVAEEVVLPQLLRLVIIGGEEARPERLAEWHAHVGGQVRLLNTYGPTETTVVATMADLGPAPQAAHVEVERRRVPIGRPIANVQIFILDRLLTPVPVGVRGEVFIGGPGLARGYHRRPDLTAERFVPHPFSDVPGARLYRTGDMARYLPDGSIEFLGRRDAQVKIRGFRVEPGETEAALRAHEAVSDVAVVTGEDGRGEKRLIAYVVSAREDFGTSGEWRGFLRQRVPEYMIPAMVVRMPALPRTASGKLDRGALPPPDWTASRPTSATTAQSALQQTVAAVWSDVLGMEGIPSDANFFELGGHSLLATQVISRLQNALQVDVTLRDLFDAPTVLALAQRLETRVAGTPETSGVVPVWAADGARKVPLSASQRRMWFSHQLAPEDGAYNVAAPIRLTGQLNREALRRSVVELVRRHDSLRTTFPIVDGVPVQTVTPARDTNWDGVAVDEVDLRSMPEAERLLEAKRVLTEAARRPFDLTRGPLYRLLVVRLDEDDHVALLTMHHVISDQWSLGVIGREVAALYNGSLNGTAATLPLAPVQYADFAVWQGQRLDEAVLEAQRAYWQRQLAGLQPLELPTDHARPAVQTFRGGHVSMELPAALLEGLNRLSLQQGTTLYMTLLAAFAVLLHRYTGQEDVAVGSPIANRHHLAFEGTVGTFVNTLVLRTDLSGNPVFRELVGRVREVALEAYAHQDMPFDKLVEDLQPRRDPGRPPLVSVLFNLQNAPIRQVDLRGLSWAPFEIDAWASQFDISLTVDAEILKKMAIVYNSDLYEPATIQAMLQHFRNILESVVANPEGRIAQAPVLADHERRQLLVDWNATGTPEREAGGVPELFEAQVRRTPDAVAVMCGDRRLTYQDLNSQANQLAHRLLGLGVEREARVAIFVERSVDLLVGLLGIMKAGCAYVPLDRDLPPNRIAVMLRDSGAVAVVTQEMIAPLLPGDDRVRVVLLDGESDGDPESARDNPPRRARASDLAYVIYTSGSTGTPKGVEITHRALVNLLQAMQREPGVVAEDVLLSVTTITFDIAALELYLPLIVGARVVIAPRETVSDGRNLIRLIETAGATVMQATPATWRILIDAGWKGGGGLRIWCGGEALPVDLAEKLTAGSGAVWNVYGPTETTIWSTAWKVEHGEPAVGRPIANTQVYILDKHLQPVPPGVRGELYIGGEGLARGYHGRPDLTAARFVPNPFGDPGSRLFRTGDLASYLRDGNIRLLGRLDHQVKIHGYRVELGEIEAQLARHPDVQHAVVAAHEDASGARRLVAYVVLRMGAGATTEKLREALLQQLPAYMVPRAFVFLGRLPLTPSGKVDRRSLPAPDRSQLESQRVFVAPRDEIERRLVAMWEKLLGKHPIGVRDDFFELGGHSLLAAHLFVDIERELGKHLPIAMLFQAPTVEQLAEVVRKETTATPWTSLVPVQPEGSSRPFFWVHGDASTVPLARYLGPEQPLYGFEHQGADGNRARYVTVETIAAHYLSELVTVQPTGPYCLGGYSFGGVVALEMAQQLQRRGQEVKLLVLLCPSIPSRKRLRQQRRRARARLRAVVHDASRHRRALSPLAVNERLRYIGARLKGRVRGAIAPIMKTPAVQLFVGMGLRVPPSLRSSYILGVYFKALGRYAANPYRGPAVLFAEKDRPAQARYWLGLLLGPTEFHSLSARHDEVVTPLYMDGWAGHLREWIRRSQRNDASVANGDRRR